MHELGIALEIVDSVARAAAGAKVRRVRVEIGKLAAVVPEALSFCFDVCAAENGLEGVALDVVQVPGRARCRACDGEVALERPFGRCSCGSSDLEWLSGDELRIVGMEVG